MNRLQHQIYDEDKHLLKQMNILISNIDETNIINLIKNKNVNHIYLDECIRCRSITSNIYNCDQYYNKLINKISIKLKKYIDIGVLDKPSYLEFIELIKTRGVLFWFCNTICNSLGNSDELTYTNILKKLEPKLKKHRKKYEEKKVEEREERNGYIYLIRIRASVNIGEEVYKLGKTSRKFGMRMSGYDKGYEVIFVFPIQLDKLDHLELELLEELDSIYKKRLDYGNEYFEGSRMEMCRIIMEKIVK